MTDYTKLIERMRTDSAFDFTTLGNESADAIEALQSENERLNSGWHQANQDALQAKLTVKEQAKDIVLLCDDLKYIAGIARRLGMPVDDDTLKVRAAILGAVQNLEAERNALQAKLDAMGKGEPVAHCRMSPLRRAVVQWVKEPVEGPLYAAPKALAPLTYDQIDELEKNDVFLGNIYEITKEIEAAHGIGGTP